MCPRTLSLKYLRQSPSAIIIPFHSIYIYVDVMRLIHKALNGEDIGAILGADANTIKYSELSHIGDLDELLTKRIWTTALSYTKTDRTKDIGPLCQGETTSMSTSTPMVISPTSRLSG